MWGRLVPSLLLAVPVLGSGLGIGLGLSEAPSAQPTPLAEDSVTTTTTASRPDTTTFSAPTKTPIPGPTTVPDVIGDTAAQAVAQFANAGLASEFIPMTSQSVPLGVVVAQTPGPGTAVPQGSVVSIYQSSGPALVIDPNESPASPSPPTAMATTALCQLGDLSAAAVSYDVGGTVLSLVFFIDNVGSAPCSIPAEASVRLLSAAGANFGTLSAGGPSLLPGFFVLQPSSGDLPDEWWSADGGHATVITVISNWCGQPVAPISANIGLDGIGILTVRLDPSAIGEGIACEQATDSPGVISPVQVDIP
jgi:PASTA domain